VTRPLIDRPEEGLVPEISNFYGIHVYIYFSDHAPAHVHAFVGGHEAKVAIDDGRLLAGTLPAGALRRVRRWLRLRHMEVAEAWARAARHEHPGRIEPLP
jgi:hypothetical protein